jgi:NTP pyrophosphatase (non-canonical NTP hydrolase)
MDFKEYQERAKKTAAYPDEYLLIYPALGLCSETGEFANRVKRVIRDRTPINNEEAVDKMGDILWYLNQLATELGLSLEEIATRNIAKLESGGAIKEWG